MNNINIFFQAKDLLYAWTSRSLRARYQQSILGWLWAIIQPLASVTILSVIFTRFVPIDTGGLAYPIFSFVAVAPWAFFSSSLQDMTGSLVGNISLVTKVYFPREILPVSAMLARLLDFAISALCMVILIIIYQTPIFLPGLAFIPIILGIQIILILGFGLISAAANVFIRDVQPLLTLIIQLWFYACPIIYPISMVPEKYRFFYFLNPMTGIIESYRSILLYQKFPESYLLISGIEAIIILAFGYWFFKSLEFQFVDII